MPVLIFPPQYSRSQPDYHRRFAGNGRKKFSENNGDAYPSFNVFSEVIQKHAWIKNNPDINIGAKLANPSIQTPRRVGQSKKALKTNADPNAKDVPVRERGCKRCPFHDRDGHSLGECKAFASKTLEEMDSSGWALLSLPIRRPQSKGLQTNNQMQHMQGKTTQRTPPQREAEETRRWRIGRHEVHIPVRGERGRHLIQQTCTR